MSCFGELIIDLSAWNKFEFLLKISISAVRSLKLKKKISQLIQTAEVLDSASYSKI